MAKRGRPEKKEVPTIQEKFFEYYEETRKDFKQIWRYDEAVKMWAEKESIKPPYRTFESFKVSYINHIKRVKILC